MGEVSFLDALESIEIAVSHCLDDKSLVLGEKEKTSTLTLGLTSLEDHAAVDIWVKRLLEDAVIVAIRLAKEGKDVWGVLSDNDILVDNKIVFNLGLHLLSIATKCALSGSSKMIVST